MNRYWLAQNGENTGPFAEEVILDMWRRGQIHSGGQVCAEGTEEWLDAKFLINEMEIAKEQRLQIAQASQARQEQHRVYAQRRLRRESKSRLAAFVLSWLFPGLGHAYCGNWGEALLFMLLCFGALWLDLAVAGVLIISPLAVILTALASASSARRRNLQLEEELGL